MKIKLILTLLSLTLGSHAFAANWEAIPSPNIGTQANNLNAVAAVADNDVWAVGLAFNQSALTYRTLIEHWTGSSWSIVKSPSSGPGYNILNGIAVVSATDIWTVGQAGNNTLAEHWDGARWRVIATPNVANSTNFLEGITVISANDIWAAGYYRDANFLNHPLAMHWNGSAWSIVPTPVNEGGVLFAIDAISSNDIWAVGELEPAEVSLTLHWDGVSWTVIPSPNDSTEDNVLFGVTALSSNDVWAVGSAGSLKTLALHWDGASWNVIPTPSVGANTSNPVFTGIVALSSSNLWTVGQYLLPLQGSAEQTLTENWTGSSWNVVASPNAPRSNNRLRGVTATPNGTLWSVGTTGVFAKPERTFTLRKLP